MSQDRAPKLPSVLIFRSQEMKTTTRAIRLFVLTGGLFFALGMDAARADFIFDLSGSAGPDGSRTAFTASDLTCPFGYRQCRAAGHFCTGRSDSSILSS